MGGFIYWSEWGDGEQGPRPGEENGLGPESQTRAFQFLLASPPHCLGSTTWKSEPGQLVSRGGTRAAQKPAGVRRGAEEERLSLTTVP